MAVGGKALSQRAGPVGGVEGGEAINSAPEYAELRRVCLARVAAEWYRGLSRVKETTYGDLVDTGDIDDWRINGP
ncbi:hypothetical protein QC334_23500 [Streptomyces sp. DH18]|uniref:hypothetical protein n=1 Tax=Streptomyces sp. DH18 TaxID=3040126 RepID=UPI0024424ECC|nr:hypothetical protein [Streptomyces sp. DH18]MDG9685658.1 hypothetical protein [Streptomyces sp. DH18]